MPTLDLAPASTADYRALAEKRLPRPLFDYIDGGSYGETSLRRNVEDFAALALRQRVLVDVSKIDTRISLFGREWAMPVALAPIGMGGMMARRAEALAVTCAHDAGIPFCLSTVSICPLEEVAKAAAGPFWFQLYMLRDRGAVEELLARAKAVGVRTLLFTVDLPVMGARYRDMRNGLAGGLSTLGRLRLGADYAAHGRWALDVAVKGKPLTFGNLAKYVPDARTPADFRAWVDAQFDASVTWKDIEWLRGKWAGDLVLKGVLDPEDARLAARSGADGVVVSNHGGRQLDGVSSAIAMTPRIVEAAGDRLVVLMDGGVRSGMDVVKALAAGAKAVLIGRPWIWALAGRGSRGLVALLKTFRAEMNVAMALTGAPSIGDVSAALVEGTVWTGGR
ncbi:MAG: L-lactate dehydrogenase [Parvularculaceae bacterium]|nr:L-lactate dehydrogenase [Parvularculaceae bacterium]